MLQPPRLLCPQGCPGKNTGVGCHALSQGIFLTRGSSLCALPWQAGSSPLSHRGSPTRSVTQMWFQCARKMLLCFVSLKWFLTSCRLPQPWCVDLEPRRVRETRRHDHQMAWRRREGRRITHGCAGSCLCSLSLGAPLRSHSRSRERGGGPGGLQDGGKLIGHVQWNLSPELIAVVTANWVSPRRVGYADKLTVVYDYLTTTHSVSHPPAPQSLELVTLYRPEDSKHLPSYSVSKILNIKQAGKALPVSTVSGCYDVRYLMLGYTLIHTPYWYFKIIILDNGSNKELQRKTCPEEAFLTFENVHKWWIQEGTAGSPWGSDSHASIPGTETVSWNPASKRTKLRKEYQPLQSQSERVQPSCQQQ